MTVQTRSTLKSYFITGASPSEAEFADLIDSTLIVGDIEVGLASTSSVNPLSASAGKTLNDKISDITSRVIVLEDTENTFASNYYNKSEVDHLINAVDQVIYNLTYQSQINDLQDQIDNIDTTGSPSSISIGDVTGLQDALDVKATIAELNSTRDALQASIDSINTDGVDLSGVEQSIANLSAEIDSLETQLNTHPLYSSLSDLPSATDNHGMFAHVHSEGSAYFAHAGSWIKLASSSEVDALISGISLEDHQHVTADITDFNTEVEAKTNLLVSDHSQLTSNPHNVTKAQVGLDKVENLTPPEIVAAAGIATDESIADLEQQILDHTGQANPHGTTKTDIGLGNVPNVDVQQLLDLHLQEENPHDIDLNFFDVYSTAEADSRMQFYLDSVRYAFTPTYSGDSAGALGDIAWDDDFLYFKQQPNRWVKVPFSSIEEFNLDNVTKISAADIQVTGTDGSTLLSVSDAGVEIGAGSIGSLTISDTETETLLSSEKTIEISAPGLMVSDVQIQGGSLDSITEINTDTLFASSSNASTTEGNLGYFNTLVAPKVQISDFTISADLSRTPIRTNPAEFTYSYDLARWTSTVDSSFNKFAYLADLPDLSPYALKSELPSNIGQGGGDGSNTTDVVLSGSTGGLDNYAFTSGAGLYADDPNTPGDQEYWEYTDDILSTGLVIELGYGVNNPSLKYNPATQEWEAFDGVTTYGIISPYSKSELDALFSGKADASHTHSQYALTSDLLTFVPYTQLEVNDLLDNKADAIHTHAQYALIETLPNFNTFALKTELPDLSSYATLSDLAEVEAGQSDTPGLFTGTITLDSSTSEGYAETKYPDGSGGFISQKYSIDYGADGQYDTADDDDSEDYFASASLSYAKTGLVVDIGQASNPSIKYDPTSNDWEVFDGTNSFTLQNPDSAVSALVDSAPETLDTLNELAAALGDDPNFATTTSTALGNRVRVDINNQGLSSTQKTNARTNIGAQVAGSYASASHTHDGRYYTETEVDALLKAITDNLYSA